MAGTKNFHWGFRNNVKIQKLAAKTRENLKAKITKLQFRT